MRSRVSPQRTDDHVVTANRRLVPLDATDFLALASFLPRLRRVLSPVVNPVLMDLPMFLGVGYGSLGER